MQTPLLVVLGFCFVLAIFAFFVGRRQQGLFVLLPMAAALTGASFLAVWALEFFFPPSNRLVAHGHLLGQLGTQIILGIHLAAALVAAGILVLSGCVAGIYVWLYRSLKKRQGDASHFPSLGRLEGMMLRLSAVGLTFMTASVLSGMILIGLDFSLSMNLVAKMAWAFAVWAWFALMVFGQNVLGLYGKRGAWFTLVGGTVLWTGFLLVSFV